MHPSTDPGALFFTLINATSTARGSNVFIAKYDSGGHVLWAHSAGNIGNDQAFGVSTDPWGNAYVTGSFSFNLSKFP